MTSDELNTIVAAVIQALKTNSKTISQLTPVSSLSDDDSIEIGGGKRVTYAVLKSLFEVLYSTAIENGIDANNEIFFTGSKLKMSAVPDELNAALNEYFEACVRQDSDHLVDLLYSRIVLLDSMGSELDGLSYTPVAGDLVWRNGYVFKWNGTAWEDGAVQPRKHVLYINKHTGKRYMWTGTAMQELEGTSSIHVVNNLTTGGEGDALSAEQGKVLKGKIDEVQANVVNLYNRLANIAFPTAADKAAAEPTELDWSIPKVAVTITNSIGSGIAVIKRNGQAVSGSVMVEQGESLTLTIEGADGYGLTDVRVAIDGGTETQLTGVNGVFTLNVAQVNAAMSIVITGTYSQTVGITYNLTNCSKTAGPTSVVTGGGATIEITANDGYTLDSVTPTVTGATIDSWSVSGRVGTLVISNVTGAVVVSAEANEAGSVEITTTADENKVTVTDNGAKQGSTLVLTVAPKSGYGFKAAEDANDVNRGVILIKDGNNNTIVDTVNGIGLDKVTYGALTPGSLTNAVPNQAREWNSFPSFASTIITIDNAPAAVSVNVTPALIFQENAFRNNAGANIYQPYPYYMAHLIGNQGGLPCIHDAKIDNVGTITSTSKGYWGRVTTSTLVNSHEPCLICYNGDTVTGSWKTWDPQTLNLSSKVINKWIIPSSSKKDSNGIPYLEKSYLYHYPGGDTSDASDRKVIFDGSDKSMWILVFDDLTPKVVFKGIPSGVVPKRWSDSGSESRDCVKIDDYYTEWGNTSVKITMTGVSNVTCSDSNVSITESSGTFTIVVSNLATGEVRNVNLNVTV